MDPRWLRKADDNSANRYRAKFLSGRDRKSDPENIVIGDNIWYSTQDYKGNWLPLKNIGPPLNNGMGSFVTSVTPDGNTLLLGGTFRSGAGPVHFGLWMTHRTADGWSYP